MSVDTFNQEVKVMTVLKACSKETHRVARMWLYYTLFYWMFPTIAVLSSYIIANQRIRWLDLVIHGEFLIYAITIVAGSTRLISKDIPKSGPFVSRQIFNLYSHIMIFPAIVVYALLRYIGAVSTNPDPVNKEVVVIYSVVLLIASFVFSYVVFLIDAQRSTPYELPKRAVEAIAQTPETLKAKFDSLPIEDVVAAPEAPPGVTAAEIQAEEEREAETEPVNGAVISEVEDEEEQQ